MDNSYNLLKKVLPYFIVGIVITGITSCSFKKPAIGKEDEIIVVADSSDYYQVENNLLDVFGKIIYTPQPEQLFTLKRINIENMESIKQYKNIVIIAPLDSKSPVADYINKILSPEVKKMVMDDSISVINKNNLWAKDQLVMIITAPTMDKLNAAILKEHENMIYAFQKISNKRLFASLYNPKYERKDIEAKFLKKYGWIIYVQADFQLAIDDSVNNFVWLRRSPGSDMERWIFVHWINNSSPAFLNADSIAAERNRITKKFYRSSDDSSWVEISDDYKTTSEVNFLNKYAIMTQGLWRMSDHSMGGPFINYTFYDPKTRRIYMLDGSIYAPKYYKKSLIQQVDVMLQSFLTEDELSQDRKEDLLDELK